MGGGDISTLVCTFTDTKVGDSSSGVTWNILFASTRKAKLSVSVLVSVVNQSTWNVGGKRWDCICGTICSEVMVNQNLGRSHYSRKSHCKEQATVCFGSRIISKIQLFDACKTRVFHIQTILANTAL